MRVLVVGMVDSVHLYRWLSCFRDSTNEFLIFPSRRFKRLHPGIRSLLSDSGGASRYKLVPAGMDSPILQWTMWGLDRATGVTSGPTALRTRQLARQFRSLAPDVIHAMEIQHAGYLIAQAAHALDEESPVILSNWGSDLFHFARDSAHLGPIRRALRRADYYGAECRRDQDLARDLGYSGKMMPVVPNSGWLPEQAFSLGSRRATSDRLQITVKGNEDWAGRGLFCVKIVASVLEEHPSYTVHVLNAGNRVRQFLERLPLHIRHKFVLYRPGQLGHGSVLELLSNSLLYVGASVSDGICTTALEAAACGALVVQSNTSCLQEWVPDQSVASLVPIDDSQYRSAIAKMIESSSALDDSIEQSRRRLFQCLSEDALRPVMATYYNIPAGDEWN